MVSKIEKWPQVRPVTGYHRRFLADDLGTLSSVRHHALRTRRAWASKMFKILAWKRYRFLKIRPFYCYYWRRKSSRSLVDFAVENRKRLWITWDSPYKVPRLARLRSARIPGAIFSITRTGAQSSRLPSGGTLLSWSRQNRLFSSGLESTKTSRHRG